MVKSALLECHAMIIRLFKADVREVNMRDIFIDEIDKQLIYYYRNNFKTKQIAEKTGLQLNTVRNKLARLRKHGKLKRWWEE